MGRRNRRDKKPKGPKRLSRTSFQTEETDPIQRLLEARWNERAQQPKPETPQQRWERLYREKNVFRHAMAPAYNAAVAPLLSTSYAVPVAAVAGVALLAWFATRKGR
jgi:hypothetical protein